MLWRFGRSRLCLLWPKAEVRGQKAEVRGTHSNALGDLKCLEPFWQLLYMLREIFKVESGSVGAIAL
ncbi:MAG: hypothetical protein HC786_14320 [Richelia sp. CSU_2_1]|nr:hypothetical protein [Microcoleus sp. SM1_3_4]NJR23242.1 hypothetical protein [Richelia sp. CSU_2_1]